VIISVEVGIGTDPGCNEKKVLLDLKRRGEEHINGRDAPRESQEKERDGDQGTK